MILHFDPFAGISGDMMVGALIDAGLSFDFLRDELRKIPISDFEVTTGRVSRSEISATKFDVKVRHGNTHRDLATVTGIIHGSKLSSWVKHNAEMIFTRLAKAESKIHNKKLDEIHFHEVGAVDAIVDVVGTLVGLEKLGITELSSAPINLGGGFVETEQGTFPVPGPATSELLKGIPTYSKQVEGELTTPTGASILSSLVTKYGPQPPMKVQEIGYGAGARQYDNFPNVLRILIGEPISETPKYSTEESVTVVEANIDDMNPQFYGYFFDKILEAGALDVYVNPLVMKKSRPGTLLSVICPDNLVTKIIEVIFIQTTTIGVRFSQMQRQSMERYHVTVQTDYGAVKIKVCRLGERVLNFSPEFEDCRDIAEKSGRPLKEIHSLAIKKFLER